MKTSPAGDRATYNTLFISLSSCVYGHNSKCVRQRTNMYLNLRVYEWTDILVSTVEIRLQRKWCNLDFINCFRQWEATPELEVEMPHQGWQRRFFMQRVLLQRQCRCENTSGRTRRSCCIKSTDSVERRSQNFGIMYQRWRQDCNEGEVLFNTSSGLRQ